MFRCITAELRRFARNPVGLLAYAVGAVNHVPSFRHTATTADATEELCFDRFQREGASSGAPEREEYLEHA